ncbi:MAG: hypothetical protein HC824_11490 [Synechococcales cyanobacterium RM1_1_8]|nr:hypothetical protein [Synechococcales cyanobacterium RM1_1_8]
MSSLLIGQLDLTPDQDPAQASDQRPNPAESSGFEADLISDRPLSDSGSKPGLVQLKPLGKLDGSEALKELRLSRDRQHLAGINSQGQIVLLPLQSLVSPASSSLASNFPASSPAIAPTATPVSLTPASATSANPSPARRLIWPETAAQGSKGGFPPCSKV